MSKYKNPIRKYSIDALLIVIFVVLWGVIANIESLDVSWRMFLGVFEYIIYDKLLSHNKSYHE